MKRAMGTTPPPTLRTTLPARAYTDRRGSRSRWIACLRGCGWRRAAPTSSIRPGAFIRRDVAGASVLIVRGAGRLDPRAPQRLPPSRHAPVRTERAARSRAASSARITRGPTASTAALLAAPQMDEVDGFDRGRLSAAARWRARRGTATSSSTCRTDPPAPLAAQLGDCRRALRRGRMQDLRLAHRIDYDVATNWKLVVQNYNECLHCPVIHPLLNRMHHYLGAENVPSAETYCGGAMGFKDGVETLSTDGKRRRALLPGLGARDRDAGQLLRDLSELPADAPSRLHDDDHDLAAGLRPDEAGRRVAFPSGRDGEAGFRVRGRDRVLGSHQSRGLGDLGAVVSRASAHAAISRGRTQRGRNSCGSSISSCCHDKGSRRHGGTRV